MCLIMLMGLIMHNEEPAKAGIHYENMGPAGFDGMYKLV